VRTLDEKLNDLPELKKGVEFISSIIEECKNIVLKKVDEKIAIIQDITLKDHIKELKEDLSTLADFD